MAVAVTRGRHAGAVLQYSAIMAEHVVIDGNNLLYAMHEHAPVPAVGRETLVKVIERWARRGDDRVTLVFDGAAPRGGLSKQMSSSRITVRFSVPVTADDVIVDLVQRAEDAPSIRVVTSDTAISHEARLRRSRHTDSVAFVKELFAGPADNGPRFKPASEPAKEKPDEMSPEEVREWLDLFGADGADRAD